MKEFVYRARNRDGELVKGEVEASNEKDAARIIELKNLVLITISNKEEELDLLHLSTSKRVSLKELMIFTKQLAGMLEAGLSVVDSLETLADSEKNKHFSEIINSLYKDIEGGLSLSKAMENHPEIFSDIYLSLIRVGEISGNLNEMLKKLSVQLEKDYHLRSQIKGAMIYPVFILITLVAVSVLAVTFVLPKLVPILVAAEIELPTLTKILIGISEALMKFWYIIVPAVIGLSFFSYRWTRSGTGNLIWSKVKINIPIAGPIVRNIYTVRFLNTMSILLSSGISIIETLKITSKAIGNIHYEKELLRAVGEVENGTSLAEVFKDSEYVTTISKKMIKVGEATGTLDVSTGNIANFYEEEVNYQINNLTKTLEPLLIVLMGISVALFVSAVVMPLYDATTSINKI